MNNLEAKYLPIFMKDENEPFDILAVATSIQNFGEINENFLKQFDTVFTDYDFALQYEIFFDYDIEHLYDLEHVYIYVKDEKIIGIITSFHGKFLNAHANNHLVFKDDTHPILYLQPGKHAILPDPLYFNLYVELFSCCDKTAGSGGFLIGPKIRHLYEKNDELDKKVVKYIKDKFSFKPSLKFVECTNTLDILCTHIELWENIAPKILNKELEIIKTYC